MGLIGTDALCAEKISEAAGDIAKACVAPSEIAITQVRYRILAPGIAENPPEKLSPEYIKAHSGDRHGPPEEHRARFPDGRVDSQSALATAEHGSALLKAAETAVAEDYMKFLGRAAGDY